MPGTPSTTIPDNPLTARLAQPWHQAARAMCEVIDGIGELADVLQGHPELTCDCADLEAALQALVRITAVVKQRAAR